MIVSLCVDVLIFTGNDDSMFVKFKNSMKPEFEMTDLGKMKYFLGVKILQNLEFNACSVSNEAYLWQVQQSCICKLQKEC